MSMCHLTGKHDYLYSRSLCLSVAVLFLYHLLFLS